MSNVVLVGGNKVQGNVLGSQGHPWEVNHPLHPQVPSCL